jgi:DivIVA domain-containing protein
MPEERLMSISSSSHLAPDDVARHTFGSVRRGFDPEEVRAYLESIAAALRGVGEREHKLLEELADAERRAANPVLDEPTLTAALGTETARVLHSAHEVAAEIQAKAEAESNRLLTEGREEIEQSRTQTEARLAEHTAEAEAAVNALREHTNQQVAARLEEARSESDELVARAREECRAMVEEAQGLRARVLADLSRRRKVLHAQIEQLRAGRERLAETVQDVRRSIDVIADDLFAAEDNARLAAEAAGREALERPDEGSPEEMAALLLAVEAEAAVEVEPEPEPEPDPEPEPEPVVSTDEDSGASDADPTEGAEDAEAAVVTVEEPDAVEEGGPGEGSAEEAADDAQVDALFAKIRAARDKPVVEEPVKTPTSKKSKPAKVVEPESSTAASEAVADTKAATTGELPADDAEEGDDEPPEERSPLAVRRDDLIAPIVTGLARRLKRTLQDNQNDLLDSLRSSGSRWSTELLPDETEQVDGVATAALPALEQAAQAGATFIDVAGGETPHADVLVGIAHDLALALVGPLRRKLDAADGLDDAEESVVAEHVGSAFREWKGERIERLAGDHVVAAFSAGSITAAGADDTSELEWIATAGPGDTPCPDCEDNGLNGSLRPGEEFPTGHRHPPVHPGCRCLLAGSAT